MVARLLNFGWGVRSRHLKNLKRSRVPMDPTVICCCCPGKMGPRRLQADLPRHSGNSVVVKKRGRKPRRDSRVGSGGLFSQGSGFGAGDIFRDSVFGGE